MILMMMMDHYVTCLHNQCPWLTMLPYNGDNGDNYDNDIDDDIDDDDDS